MRAAALVCAVVVPVLTVFLQVLAGPTALAAGPGLNWAGASGIHYLITGVFDGRAALEASGDAHVKDRVEIEFITSLEGDLIGEVTIQNFKSEVSDLQSKPAGCRAPELQGELEYYTLKSFNCMNCDPAMAAYVEGPPDKNMLMSMATFVTDYPDMVVGTVCDGKRSVAAHKAERSDMVHIPTKTEFMMDPSVVNSDKKHLDPGAGIIEVRELDWTWTYQATPVRQ